MKATSNLSPDLKSHSLVGTVSSEAGPQFGQHKKLILSLNSEILTSVLRDLFIMDTRLMGWAYKYEYKLNYSGKRSAIKTRKPGFTGQDIPLRPG